jgi:hypothetical protein
MDYLTEQYSQTTVENSYLKKELEEVREVLKKKEEEHEKTIENISKENNETKEKNLSVIDELTVLRNQEKLELTSKLQTTQDSLNIITKELEV